MNRTRALLTAGITTALSAAAIAATAAAQGVFDPSTSQTGQAVVSADGPSDGTTPPPVVRELEPIVIHGAPPAGAAMPDASQTSQSSSGLSGRNGSDDGPFHDLNDDKGGLRDDDRDDDDDDRHDDDDDDDRHGDDDDDDRHGDDDDDDDDDDRRGRDDDDDD
jgi:hypothetical protein